MCSITLKVDDMNIIRKKNTTTGKPKKESYARNLTPPFCICFRPNIDLLRTLLLWWACSVLLSHLQALSNDNLLL